MNELRMAERETILGLLRLGWSARRIERETGHRRETVARYGREAGLLPPPKPASDGEVATDPPAVAGASIATRSACEPYRDFIEGAGGAGGSGVAAYPDS